MIISHRETAEEIKIRRHNAADMTGEHLIVRAAYHVNVLKRYFHRSRHGQSSFLSRLFVIPRFAG